MKKINFKGNGMNSKKIKVGINGFGRIGRAIFRNNLVKKYFDIVCINDVNNDIDNLAYQLKYDTTYGKLNNKVDVKGSCINVDEIIVKVYNNHSIDKVDWKANNVDIIIDSSGVASNLTRSRNLKNQNIKFCVVTNSPPKNMIDKTVVMGVNEQEIDQKDDFLISSSICDANAFVHNADLHEKNFGIEHGILTTLHPWLGYQNLLDGPSVSYSSPGEIHDHYALGRSSFGTIIPKTTSAIKASCNVLDHLEDKFLSFSYRVPTMIVGSADASIKLKKSTNTEQIKNILFEASKNQNYNIFFNNTKNLISSDFIKSDFSVIVDHRWLLVNDRNYLKIVLWYDNEWGYSARVVDLVSYLGSLK